MGHTFQNPLGLHSPKVIFRVCGVMVAHDIWDVEAQFESDIFYYWGMV